MTLTNKAPSKVDQILAKRQAERAQSRAPLSDEQKERMKEQEPTEAQITMLLDFGVSQATIDTLTKYDASELIEKRIAEREASRKLPGSISEKQLQILIKCGYGPQDVEPLSYYEAYELIDRTFPAKGRK